MASEEPIVTGMAGRYASALFALALEADAIDSVKTDLDKFDALMTESADLARLVRSPVFSSEERVKALSMILESGGMHGLTGQFLKLVASNRRLFAVRDMIKAFRRLVAGHKGEITAHVTVAERLKDEYLATLADALRSIAGGKKVDLAVKLDPSMIGGLIVKLGSRMVDSSLRTKLNALKHAMKEVS
jgi:F-type H+-transporting ATPase subunit delta